MRTSTLVAEQALSPAIARPRGDERSVRDRLEQRRIGVPRASTDSGASFLKHLPAAIGGVAGLCSGPLHHHAEGVS